MLGIPKSQLPTKESELLLVTRMDENPENDRDDQKDERTVHVDSSTAKQIELDRVYAEILQGIEDRRAAILLTIEEKEKEEDSEEKEKG